MTQDMQALERTALLDQIRDVRGVAGACHAGGDFEEARKMRAMADRLQSELDARSPYAPMRPQPPVYEPLPWRDPTAQPWRPSLNAKFAFAVAVGIVIGMAFNWVTW